jgi:MFS transporter, putative metabolite:H+ symporter
MDFSIRTGSKPGRLASAERRSSSILSLGVIVAALGYFVDIYDLVLFSVVRVSSLQSIGISGQALVDQGTLLLNLQMFGMLLGGVGWGILGDKRGRISILFGSIILYSLANVANAFANSFGEFLIWRFIAGVGLAGELGAGITLVAECLATSRRGQGAAIVAGFGVLGAVAANLVAEQLDWRSAYLVGGAMGLALLLLRSRSLESGLFQSLKSSQPAISRGNFVSLFTRRERFVRYINCILVGLPLWYVVGILITFSPEFAKLLAIRGEISAGWAVMFCYLGFAAGDFLSGFVSQALRTRKKVILGFLAALGITLALFFNLHGAKEVHFYGVCFLLGVTGGYWAVLLMMSAEQFGTNLRATVATTVRNFIRGALIPVTIFFQICKPAVGMIGSAALTGFIALVIAATALHQLDETCNRSLDFLDN